MVWVSGVALTVALGMGVGAHYGLSESDHAVTGWVAFSPNGLGFLPLTAVYFLYPLFLAALATARPRWGRLDWPWMGLLAMLVTILGLLIQGETGISALTVLATVAWWMSCTGRVRYVLGFLAVAPVLLVVALAASTSSPELFLNLQGTLSRVSWLVLGPTDGRAEQFSRAWNAFRDAGWWGTGLRDPGGPLNVPAWTNDFLTMTTARFLGIPGAAALVAAALLPACSAARSAANEPFSTDADQARPAALFTISWATLWAGAVAWISAGAMGIIPLSGLTLGLCSPSSNHLIWTLPAVAWTASRMVARASAVALPVAGLRLSLHLVSAGLILVGSLIIWRGWARLADRDDVWTLPLEMSGTERITADGEGLLVDGSQHVAHGDTFLLGRARFETVTGPGLALIGIHLEPTDLDGGIHFGAAGRHAPIHLDLLPEYIALSNDVWLESDAATAWRELTLRRVGSQIIAEAPMDGSAITVIELDGGSCDAQSAGEYCVVSDSSRISIRDAYTFVAHLDGFVLDLDWTGGAPYARQLAPQRGLVIGDRTLSPVESADQLTVGEARSEIGLLGQVGALSMVGGKLTVVSEPPASTDPRGSETAVLAAAQVAFRTWLRPSTSCPGGWAWSRFRDPFGVPCVADVSSSRLWTSSNGRVLDVRFPRTQATDAMAMPESRTARGMIRDQFGTPIYMWVDRTGMVTSEPSLTWLGERGIYDVLITRGTPTNGTRTVTSYTGLQRVFQRLLSGRLSAPSPWVELWDRLRVRPRVAGGDVRLTLSLPYQRVAAAAAAKEAHKLATASVRLGNGRMKTEVRECPVLDQKAIDALYDAYGVQITSISRAYEVNVVMTAPDGALLAAVTAVGIADDAGSVSVIFENGSAQIPCLPSFSGPLRALSAPVRAGSTQKVWSYATALDLALHGNPNIQLVAKGDDYLVLNLNDPENGALDPADPTDTRMYYVDHKLLAKVAGRDVDDCRDHGTASELPFHVIDAFAQSTNTPACLLATLANLDADHIGPVLRALQLEGPLDLLPAFGDDAVDRSRLPTAPFGRGGEIAMLSDGRVSVREAPKAPLGKDIQPTTLGLTAAVRAIGNGGRATSPYLLLGASLPDGTTWSIGPRPSVQVFSEEVSALIELAMHKAVVEGTGVAATRDMAPFRIDGLKLKTGTADQEATVRGQQVALPSPKAAVALYPDGPSAISIAVWCRLAQGLDNDAALNVVHDIVESGALDGAALISAAP